MKVKFRSFRKYKKKIRTIYPRIIKRTNDYQNVIENIMKDPNLKNDENKIFKLNQLKKELYTIINDIELLNQDQYNLENIETTNFNQMINREK